MENLPGETTTELDRVLLIVISETLHLTSESHHILYQKHQI